MQELVGRLTSLDPEAGEGLKVIAYFDALVAGDVSTEALARAAAALSGTAAGAETADGALRVGANGARLASDPSSRADRWPAATSPDGRRVWIERDGPAHANDRIVLERFALATAVLRARRRTAPDDAVRVAIDPLRSDEERATAAARLVLGPGPVRVLATTPEEAPVGPTTLVPTAYGVLRATIVAPGVTPSSGRSGAGTAGDAAHLAASWTGALLAWRLADDDAPHVDAADLGVLLDVIRTAEPDAATHPDVRALRVMDDRSRRLLDTLVRADSVRQAALALGMHHSTLQARHEGLARALGYDPRLHRGRYQIAALLLRLSG